MQWNSASAEADLRPRAALHSSRTPLSVRGAAETLPPEITCNSLEKGFCASVRRPLRLRRLSSPHQSGQNVGHRWHVLRTTHGLRPDNTAQNLLEFSPIVKRAAIFTLAKKNREVSSIGSAHLRATTQRIHGSRRITNQNN